jgi:hypothetical protein
MRRRRTRNRTEFNPLAGLVRIIPKLCLLALVLLPVAELVAEIAVARIPEPRPIASSALTDPQLGELYASPDVAPIREMLVEMRDFRDTVYAPLVEYRMKPFAGNHVGIGADGWRTVPRVEGGGAKVFVFGGSTTFGIGSADGQTIPAQLDALLLEAGKSAQLFNFGVPGWFSTQERIALEQMLAAGNKPDLAIFIDGLEDLRHCAAPDRTGWSARLARIDDRHGLEGMLEQSAFLQLLHRLAPAEIKPDTAPPACASDGDVERALARLDANRRMIAAIADRFGFKVLFVQQPVPSFGYDNAKRAVPVSPAEMVPLVAVAKGYSRLAEARAAGRLPESDLLWLADLEPASGNAYVDTMHYSPLFNRSIAEAVSRRIIDGHLLP